MTTNTVLHGDCLDVMKDIPDNSIDSIITDPPYGLSFMGKKWDCDVPSVDIWKECLRVLKPGGTALIFAGSRTQHRMAVNIEDAGFILKDTLMWIYGSGFPKASNISKQIDKKFGKLKDRKVLAINEKDQRSNAIENNVNNTHNAGFKPEGSGVITEPHTDEAKQWDGWKSHAIKPAYEPIIMAIKPNDGSYAENALKHGVSGLNIDECRIKIDLNNKNERRRDLEPYITDKREHIQRGHIFAIGKISKMHESINITFDKGRFPANIMFDEAAAAVLDEQTNDNSSRFFYVAKASQSERNTVCESTKNHHPTVKPLQLMIYLCKLTSTPTGGIVLDPFAGSGTTGVACINTNRQYILIEKEKEYIDIIHKRLSNLTGEPMPDVYERDNDTIANDNNLQYGMF